jgi:subtilase family serine protease
VGCSAGQNDTLDEGDRVAAAFAKVPKVETQPLGCAAKPKPGFARCFAERVVQNGIQPMVAPASVTANQLQAAYKLDTSLGAGKVIAIVDAMDDPNAESDLQVYRSQYGLPACTTANGCFRKIDQNGGTNYPTADSGWAGEIALDLDMASAACPKCKILLVEANSANISDLGAAVNQAAAQGATVISNSYGGSEDGSENTSDTDYYNHPGIGIFASSGDSGYGASYPATGGHIIAVGGTSLATASGARGWAEKAWSSAGSGCSSDVAKPSWQNGVNTACSNRAEADVSANADPATGPRIYDTYGGSGWYTVGGTSASSPLVAAIYALYGLGSQDPSYAWTHTANFFDVTSGSNGSCGTVVCNAGKGWDGPTGWGTPNGAALAGGATTNDFSISATPASRTVAAGSSTTFTISTAVTSGSAQSVSLSVSGLPTGATGSFSPTSVTAGGSATLTVSTTSSATAGTFTLTITGTGSAATHAATVSLTITGGTGGGGPTIASVTLARTTPPTSGANGIVVVVNDTVSITDVILTWTYNGKVIKASAPNATSGWTVTQSGNKYTFSATIGTGARPWTVQAIDSAGKSATQSGTFTFN